MVAEGRDFSGGEFFVKNVKTGQVDDQLQQQQLQLPWRIVCRLKKCGPARVT